MIAEAPLLRAEHTQPVTQWLIREGRQFSKTAIAGRMATLSSQLYHWFGNADVVVSPTVSQPAPRLGLARDPDAGPRETFERAAVFGAFTAIFNVTGQPAISIPAGCTEHGLPMGIQLAGKLYSETTLIQQIGRAHV